MNKTTATAIVKSINPDASDVLVSEMLDSSKGKINGVDAFRPYIVGARSLALNPPNSNLKKAETLEWFDWKGRVDLALAQQMTEDATITDIPEGWLTLSLELLPMTALVSNSGLP